MVRGAEAVAVVVVDVAEAEVAELPNRIKGGDNRCREVPEAEEVAAWAEAVDDRVLVLFSRAGVRTVDTHSHTSQVCHASIRHVRNAEQ